MVRDFADCESWLKSWRCLLLLLLSSPAEISVFIFDTCFFCPLCRCNCAQQQFYCSLAVTTIHTHTHTNSDTITLTRHANTHTHKHSQTQRTVHSHTTEQVRKVVGSSRLTGVFCTYFFGFLLFCFFVFLFCFRFC